MTTQPRPAPFTADEFVAWAAEQPEARYELAGGEIVAMVAERIGPSRAKFAAARLLHAAAARLGAGCGTMIDGVAVRIDDRTVYEPDALVRRGPPLPDSDLLVPDPVIVVEVVSPSSRSLDTGAKLAGYLGLPSLRQSLVVNTEARTVTHHRKLADGEIATRILRAGPLTLDPPGMAVEVERFFPPSIPA
jgi:Uma2 family endonuclease